MRPKRSALILAGGVALGFVAGGPALAVPLPPATPLPVTVHVSPGQISGPASVNPTDDPVGTVFQIASDVPGMVDELPCVHVKYYLFEVNNDGDQNICPITEPCVEGVYCPPPD